MKKAFTMAEVLITLGIIGIVAAMTLPSLVQKYRERQYVTALKKAVSVLDNAYRLFLFQNGGNKELGYKEPSYVPLPPEEGTGVYDENGNYNSDIFFNEMKKYLNVAKDCGLYDGDKCFPKELTFHFRSKTWNLISAQGYSRRFFVLNDGTAIGMTPSFAYTDDNALQKPKMLDYDVFQIGFGDKSVTYYDDTKGEVKCYTNEFTCSSWVLINGNMDYLHCRDLSWSGKSSCKN